MGFVYIQRMRYAGNKIEPVERGIKAFATCEKSGPAELLQRY